MAHKLAGRATWNGIQSSVGAVDRVAAVRSQLPSDELFAQASETFAALADQTRAKIICALSVCDLNVGELAEVVGLTHSAISHQLRTLRYLGVVRFRKEGSTVHYSLDDSHLKTMFEEAVYHAEHVSQAGSEMDGADAQLEAVSSPA